MKIHQALLLLAIALVPSLASAKTVQVVTLSTVLADLSQQIGGERVQVYSLVKPGIDPHEFQPTPDDVKSLRGADLVLASGKGMEGYLDKLKSSNPQLFWVEVGKGLPSLHTHAGENAVQPIDPVWWNSRSNRKLELATHSSNAPDANNGGIIDPHWWHSISNMKLAAEIVRDALIKVNPASEKSFKERTENYLKRLDELNTWAKVKVAELPRDHRKLVTSHDAFQYFARDFGFVIYPIEGVSTEDQPSSRKVAQIIEIIKAERVKAVFFENIENPKVIEQITKETGAKIGGELYADGLGKGDCSTYEGMMRHNISTVVDALK